MSNQVKKRKAKQETTADVSAPAIVGSDNGTGVVMALSASVAEPVLAPEPVQVPEQQIPIRGLESKPMAIATDIATAITQAKTATASQSNSMAAANAIQDIDGNLQLVQLKIQEAAKLMQEINKVADAGDSAFKTTVTGLITTLTT